MYRIMRIIQEDQTNGKRMGFGWFGPTSYVNVA